MQMHKFFSRLNTSLFPIGTLEGLLFYTGIVLIFFNGTFISGIATLQHFDLTSMSYPKAWLMISGPASLLMVCVPTLYRIIFPTKVRKWNED